MLNKTPVHHREIISVLGIGSNAVKCWTANCQTGVYILGNIGLIYLFTTVYLLVILGIGLFISNYTDTQQQAMFIACFLQ
jgi:ABC-2 type transport system permease protein